MTRCIVAALMLSAAVLGAQANPQTGAIAGVVVTHEGGIGLPYSVVALPERGEERFTSETGVFFFSGLPPGPTVIRVRRLGFSPSTVTFHVRSGFTDTVRIELSRVAVRLATVNVRALPPCKRPGPPNPTADSTLAAIYSQLLLNAEQYRLLSETYPFMYVLESTLSHTGKDDVTLIDDMDTTRIVSNESWKYLPGQVLERESFGRRAGSHVLRIPTLLNFADPDFINNHCFHNSGLVVEENEELIRIDAVAAERIKTPDVNAAIFLEPVTFHIRRTVLHLSRRPRIRGMVGNEVTTEFREVLPSISVISVISADQFFDPKARGVAFKSAHEEQRIILFGWVGRKPGEDAKP